jgi:hypothetical protein
MDIVDRLRSTTEAMASHASVDMALWDRHSNACLEAAAEITRLRKERDEARAAMAWQPIKTAPKDGTLILIYDPTVRPYWPHSLSVDVVCWDDVWEGGNTWRSSGYTDYANTYPAATHWMPLPEPEATK